MDINACAHCGTEIKNQGIHFRGRSFCCDECCEEFDSRAATSDEPGAEDLSADGADELDDDLGYRDGDEVADGYEEDDYEIKPEDF